MGPNWWYWFVARVCGLFFKLHNGLKVYGLEHVPDDKPLIVAANHVSVLDPMVIGITFPRRLRPIAKEELFTGNKFFAWFIRSLGAFPLNRETGSNAGAALKKFSDLLKEGQDMMIFPEGGRSPTGRLQVLEGGAALVAAKQGVPILPAFIYGAFEAMPMGSSSLSRHKLRVIYGKPIYPPQGLSSKEARNAMHDALSQALNELQEQADRGLFD